MRLRAPAPALAPRRVNVLLGPHRREHEKNERRRRRRSAGKSRNVDVDVGVDESESGRWRSVVENLEAIDGVAGWSAADRAGVKGANALELFGLAA